MAKDKGRRPDYNLKALNKDTEERGPIGVGWMNTDGSISIKLNACVTYPAGPQWDVRLFPNDRKDAD